MSFPISLSTGRPSKVAPEHPYYNILQHTNPADSKRVYPSVRASEANEFGLFSQSLATYGTGVIGGKFLYEKLKQTIPMEFKGRGATTDFLYNIMRKAENRIPAFRILLRTTQLGDMLSPFVSTDSLNWKYTGEDLFQGGRLRKEKSELWTYLIGQFDKIKEAEKQRGLVEQAPSVTAPVTGQFPSVAAPSVTSPISSPSGFTLSAPRSPSALAKATTLAEFKSLYGGEFREFVESQLRPEMTALHQELRGKPQDTFIGRPEYEVAKKEGWEKRKQLIRERKTKWGLLSGDPTSFRHVPDEVVLRGAVSQEVFGSLDITRKQELYEQFLQKNQDSVLTAKQLVESVKKGDVPAGEKFVRILQRDRVIPSDEEYLKGLYDTDTIADLSKEFGDYTFEDKAYQQYTATEVKGQTPRAITQTKKGYDPKSRKWKTFGFDSEVQKWVPLEQSKVDGNWFSPTADPSSSITRRMPSQPSYVYGQTYRQQLRDAVEAYEKLPEGRKKSLASSFVLDQKPKGSYPREVLFEELGLSDLELDQMGPDKRRTLEKAAAEIESVERRWRRVERSDWYQRQTPQRKKEAYQQFAKRARGTKMTHVGFEAWLRSRKEIPKGEGLYNKVAPVVSTSPVSIDPSILKEQYNLARMSEVEFKGLVQTHGVEFRKTGKVYGDIVIPTPDKDVLLAQDVFLMERPSTKTAGVSEMWEPSRRQVAVYSALKDDHWLLKGFEPETRRKLGRSLGFVGNYVGAYFGEFVHSMNRFLQEPAPFLDEIFAWHKERPYRVSGKDPLSTLFDTYTVPRHIKPNEIEAYRGLWSRVSPAGMAEQWVDSSTVLQSGAGKYISKRLKSFERIPFGRLHHQWMRPYVTSDYWSKTSMRMLTALSAKGAFWTMGVPSAYGLLDDLRSKFDSPALAPISTPLFAGIGLGIGSLLKSNYVEGEWIKKTFGKQYSNIFKSVPITKTQMGGLLAGAFVGAAPIFNQGITAGIGGMYSNFRVASSKMWGALGVHDGLERQEGLFPGITSPFTAMGFGMFGGLLGYFHSEMGTVRSMLHSDRGFVKEIAPKVEAFRDIARLQFAQDASHFAGYVPDPKFHPSVRQDLGAILPNLKSITHPDGVTVPIDYSVGTVHLPTNYGEMPQIHKVDVTPDKAKAKAPRQYEAFIATPQVPLASMKSLAKDFHVGAHAISQGQVRTMFLDLFEQYGGKEAPGAVQTLKEVSDILGGTFEGAAPRSQAGLMAELIRAKIEIGGADAEGWIHRTSTESGREGLAAKIYDQANELASQMETAAFEQRAAGKGAVGRAVEKVKAVGTRKSPGFNRGAVRGIAAFTGLSVIGAAVAGPVGGNFSLGDLIPGWIVRLTGGGERSRKTSDIFSGKEEVAIRKGRWWIFGRSPFEGTKTEYFRPHRAVLMQSEAEDTALYGSRAEKKEYDPLLHPIQYLLDPEFKYHRETRMSQMSPTPLTGQPLRDVPIFGDLLGSTVGEAIKPTRKIRASEWMTPTYNPLGAFFGEQQDLQAPPGHFAWGKMSIAPPVPMLGGATNYPVKVPGTGQDVFGKTFKRLTEQSGLKGFMLRSFLEDTTSYDSSSPDPIIETSDTLFSTRSAFWGLQAGDPGWTEGLRRYLPYDRNTYYNPLSNLAPSWLPGTGSEFYRDFSVGNYFDKVPDGSIRLPGAGLETLHPELKPFHPENYPIAWKYKILSDVAQGSEEWHYTKQKVIGQLQAGVLSDREKEVVAQTNKQLDEKRNSKAFHKYRFDQERLKRVDLTVTAVFEDGTFAVAELGKRPVKLGGVNYSMAALSREVLRKQNLKTVEDADRLARDYRADIIDTIQGQVKAGQKISGFVPVDNTKLFHGRFSSVYIPELSNKVVNMGAEVDSEDPFYHEVMYSDTQKAFGSAWEQFTHKWIDAPFSPATLMNQLLPISPQSKFIQRLSPVEQYARTQVYGREVQMWQNYKEDFLDLTTNELVARVSGDFIPRKLAYRRTMMEYMDKVTWLRNFALEQAAKRTGNEIAVEFFHTKKKETMFGLDPYKGFDEIWQALPRSEKDFYREFLNESDPVTRQRILDLVPQHSQHLYIAQWQNQDIQALYQKVSSGVYTDEEHRRLYAMYNVRRVEGMNWNEDLQQQYERDSLAREEVSYADWVRLKEISHYFKEFKLPDKNWVGFNPQVDMDDIMLQMALNEGISPKDFQLWGQQESSLKQKPYIQSGAKQIQNWTAGDNARSPGELEQEIRNLFHEGTDLVNLAPISPSMGGKVIIKGQDTRSEEVRRLMRGYDVV